jgi:hypothetical protein
MGYTTDFEGSLKFKRPLGKKKVEYLNRLFDTRRMKRDVSKLMRIYKGKHGNPFTKEKTPEAIYGYQGEFFAREDGQAGQTQDDSILAYNTPAGQSGFRQGEIEKGQPGLWCGWCITEDGKELEWNGGEKFYNYTEWLKYIIKNFFIPWGVVANGEINWYGEDRSDMGKIKVRNNEVFVFNGEVTYPNEDE